MRTIGSTAIAIALATTIASAQTPPTVPPVQTTPPTQAVPPGQPLPPPVLVQPLPQAVPVQPLPQAQTPAPMPQAQTVPPVRSTTASDMAPVQVLATLPANAATITHWYKQAVYDMGNNKIGDIEDIIVDRDAKIVGLMVGIGGFLGIGEKHVAVPYNMVHVTTRDNNKYHLVMNATKDSLKNAAGYKYDRTAMTWMPENAPATTGSSPSSPPRR